MLHAQVDLMATLEASVFFSATQKQLMSAKTSVELEVAARALDSQAFDALPYEAREDLGALYAHRLYHITGAFLG